MLIQTRPRQSGKTTKLLKKMAENEDCILIVYNLKEKRQLVDKIRREVWKITNAWDRIFSISDLTNVDQIRKLNNKIILIDEFQYVLEELFKQKIDTCYGTWDNREYKPKINSPKENMNNAYKLYPVKVKLPKLTFEPPNKPKDEYKNSFKCDFDE